MLTISTNTPQRTYVATTSSGSITTGTITTTSNTTTTGSITTNLGSWHYGATNITGVRFNTNGLQFQYGYLTNNAYASTYFNMRTYLHLFQHIRIFAKNKITQDRARVNFYNLVDMCIKLNHRLVYSDITKFETYIHAINTYFENDPHFKIKFSISPIKQYSDKTLAEIREEFDVKYANYSLPNVSGLASL